MSSLIEMLRKDEHLCNVLNSRPGRNWLRDKTGREGRSAKRMEWKQRVPGFGTQPQKNLDKIMQDKKIFRMKAFSILKRLTTPESRPRWRAAVPGRRSGYEVYPARDTAIEDDCPPSRKVR